MEDIRWGRFRYTTPVLSFVISFYLAIPVEINNLSCLGNSIHLLQKRVKCLIHEWHHLKWRIKEKWKTKSMLKAIMLKFNIQIKLQRKKNPFERFHPHHNSLSWSVSWKMIPSVLDPNSLIYIPYPRVNSLKTIPFTAAHTYIAHIWQYPSSRGTHHSVCIL